MIVTGVLLPKCPVRGWLLPAEIREGGHLSGVTRSTTRGLPWRVPRWYHHKVAQTECWLKSQKLILLQFWSLGSWCFRAEPFLQALRGWSVQASVPFCCSWAPGCSCLTAVSASVFTKTSSLVCAHIPHMLSPTRHGLGPTLLQVTTSYLMTSMKTSFPSKAVHRSWGLGLNRSLPGHHSPRSTGCLQR